MRVGKWPFDIQICKLAFGSYTYGKNLLHIKLFKDRSKFTSKELSIVISFAHINSRVTWCPVGPGKTLPIACCIPTHVTAVVSYGFDITPWRFKWPVLSSTFIITQNSQSEAVIKKIPVGVGVSVLSFLSRDHTKWSILEAKDNRRSLTWSIDLKNKKDGGGLGDKSFFDFTRSSVSFLRAGLPSRVRAKLIEKTKNHMLGYSLV